MLPDCLDMIVQGWEGNWERGVTTKPLLVPDDAMWHVRLLQGGHLLRA